LLLVQLLYVMYLPEDLHPHPTTYVGYFLKYLVKNKFRPSSRWEWIELSKFFAKDGKY